MAIELNQQAIDEIKTKYYRKLFTAPSMKDFPRRKAYEWITEILNSLICEDENKVNVQGMKVGDVLIRIAKRGYVQTTKAEIAKRMINKFVEEKPLPKHGMAVAIIASILHWLDKEKK